MVMASSKIKYKYNILLKITGTDKKKKMSNNMGKRTNIVTIIVG